jgi:hypothetical protein
MTKNTFLIPISLIILTLCSCSKDNIDCKSYTLKAVDFITNEPIKDVEIGLGLQYGCLKTFDFRKVFTDKNGKAEIDLEINQDSVDVYSQTLPENLRYFNNSFDYLKEGYGCIQLKQDTFIQFQYRPIFAEKKLVTMYMFKNVPITIEYKNNKTNLSDKNLDFRTNFYPKHPLLKPEFPVYGGAFANKTEPKDFVRSGFLAAISYDAEIIITQYGEQEADPKVTVYSKKFPITIDPINVENNKITVEY